MYSIVYVPSIYHVHGSLFRKNALKIAVCTSKPDGFLSYRVSVDPSDWNPLRIDRKSIGGHFNLSNRLVDVGVDDALVNEVCIGSLQRFAVARQSLEASILQVEQTMLVYRIQSQNSFSTTRGQNSW